MLDTFLQTTDLYSFTTEYNTQFINRVQKLSKASIIINKTSKIHKSSGNCVDRK